MNPVRVLRGDERKPKWVIMFDMRDEMQSRKFSTVGATVHTKTKSYRISGALQLFEKCCNAGVRNPDDSFSYSMTEISSRRSSLKLVLSSRTHFHARNFRALKSAVPWMVMFAPWTFPPFYHITTTNLKVFHCFITERHKVVHNCDVEEKKDELMYLL